MLSYFKLRYRDHAHKLCRAALSCYHVRQSCLTQSYCLTMQDSEKAVTNQFRWTQCYRRERQSDKGPLEKKHCVLVCRNSLRLCCHHYQHQTVHRYTPCANCNSRIILTNIGYGNGSHSTSALNNLIVEFTSLDHNQTYQYPNTPTHQCVLSTDMRRIPADCARAFRTLRPIPPMRDPWELTLPPLVAPHY